MTQKTIGSIRKEYRLSTLDEVEIPQDPFTLFEKWMDDAITADIKEPNAMFLATCGEEGIPSGRIVLLKDYDRTGLVFFTNYNSRKGIELYENPHASVGFFWKEIERQVRIQGMVMKTSEKESEEYFNSRPMESRKAAIISPQSSVIPGRKFLDESYRSLNDESLDRPPHWGGYRLDPFMFEFWQGREYRLHDRIQYRLQRGRWIIERLAP